MKHRICFGDGTEVSSGEQGAAIVSVELTRSVNAGQELTAGAVCAAMAEISLLCFPREIAAGEEFTLFCQGESGQETQVGIFYAEKPVCTGEITKLTAYDRVSFLDRDVSDKLAELTDWPYSLADFADRVCSWCSVELTGELLSEAYPVEAFSGQGITGRQVLSWIGQLGGRFCRANPEGILEWGWYTPADITLTPTGEGEQAQYYFAGELTRADYQTAPIDKVQIRTTDTDVGFVYPPDAGVGNAYVISGNPLVSADAAPVAEALYRQMQGITYTPCSVSLPGDTPLQPGQRVLLQDPRGGEIQLYVMQSVYRQGRLQVSCTGSATRENSTAANTQSYQALSGKVLELETRVQGLRAENRDAQGNLTRLEMEVEGLRTESLLQSQTAQGLKQSLTSLEQTAGSLSATVKTIQDTGVTRVENAFGLTIDGSAVEICRQGTEMTNRLDETGMLVLRGSGTANETVMLRADARGVVATDVSVGNYLQIGSFARLEDYTDGTDSRRTACYFTS